MALKETYPTKKSIDKTPVIDSRLSMMDLKSGDSGDEEENSPQDNPSEEEGEASAIYDMFCQQPSEVKQELMAKFQEHLDNEKAPEDGKDSMMSKTFSTEDMPES